MHKLTFSLSPLYLHHFLSSNTSLGPGILKLGSNFTVAYFFGFGLASSAAIVHSCSAQFTRRIARSTSFTSSTALLYSF